MIRYLIYGVPTLLCALLVWAFIQATQIAGHKKNEMMIGSLGEPSGLNPLIGADGAASSVTSLIFNGLLRFNENLEVIGDLAERWEERQTTTFFAPSEEAASVVVARIRSLSSRWKDWALTQVHQEGTHILLEFSIPGKIASEEIYEEIKDLPLVATHIVRVALQEPAKASLVEFKSASAASRQIVREWFDTSSSYELTVVGEPSAVVAALKDFYQARPDLKAQIDLGEEQAFLAEPEVTFYLRSDVRWHDGQPFTSHDAVFTYEAIMDEKVASPRKPDFERILRVDAPDAHTFHVVYRQPFSPALNSWMMSLVPAHILEGKSPAWWAENFNRHPIGTGPFKFDTWKTNEYLRVVRNTNYFRGGPWLDAVVFRMLADQLTLRLAFETGQVDFWTADPWAVGATKEDPRFSVFSSPSNSYTYVGWNLRRPIFQDIRVREAFAHAVNIPEMIRYILYGNGEQSTGVYTPTMWFFNNAIQPLTYDPEKAAQLLDEAGWKMTKDGRREKNGEPLTFTLITNNANETRRDIAALVQDHLRRLGVTVSVETYEWVVFLTRFINTNAFDACVLGWSLGYDFDQYQIWHSSQTNPGQLNMVGYKNPEVDRLLTQIRQEYRRDEVIRLAGEIQKIIYADQPYLFLYVPLSTTAIWKGSYRIFRPGPDGEWVDEPVRNTKAGWSYWMEYFYRPEFPPEALTKKGAH